MKKIRVFVLGLVVVGLVFLSGCISQKEMKRASSPAKEYDPKEMVFFAMGPSNEIKIVDPSTNEVVDILPANNNPHGIAVTPDGKYVFTTGTKMNPKEMLMEPDHEGGEEMDMEMMKKLGSNYIAVTDTSTKQIIKKIEVGGGTHHLAITPDGTKVLATIPSKSGIVVIDVQTLEKSNLIETGNITNYVTIASDGKTAYISNKGEDTISVVDLQTELQKNKIPVGVRPDHLTVSSDNKLVYVANGGSDDVAVIDTSKNQVITKISVGEAPHGIAITLDNKKVYVSNSKSKSISVIDTATNTVIKEIKVAGEVEHLEISLDGKKVYSSGEADGVVWVIDTLTDTLANTIEIGKEPHQIAIPYSLNLKGYTDISPEELLSGEVKVTSLKNKYNNINLKYITW
ncbi:MAG: beta-propeller fold lactonase family protein [Methanosarcinales archaeon]